MAGVHAEIRSLFAQSAQNYIVASRIAQGKEDLRHSTAEERQDIEVRWLTKRNDLKSFLSSRQKQKGKSIGAAPPQSPAPTSESSTAAPDVPPRTGWLHTRHMSFDERKRLQEQKKAWQKRQDAIAAGNASGAQTATHASSTAKNEPDAEVERSILTAVEKTSRGDPVEDARIEQAIRASVSELRQRSTDATSGPANHGFPSDIKGLAGLDSNDLEGITEEEYQALIEQALSLSMTEGQQQGIQMRDLEEEDVEEEQLKRTLERSQEDLHATSQAGGPNDDEELKRAIKASQAEHVRPGSHAVDDDEELRWVMGESERAHQEALAREHAQKTEEEIVMEYVKKQSLAEAQFRQTGTNRGAAQNDGNDEEELSRAIEESMRASGQTGEGSGSASGSRDPPPPYH